MIIIGEVLTFATKGWATHCGTDLDGNATYPVFIPDNCTDFIACCFHIGLLAWLQLKHQFGYLEPLISWPCFGRIMGAKFRVWAKYIMKRNA